MMNKNILANYQTEILDLFKTQYRKMSTKGGEIEFKNVLNSTFSELGIANFEHHEVKYLEEWFFKIHHLLFVKDFLVSNSVNEIIFHSNESVQLLFHGKKENCEVFSLTPEDYQLAFEIFALKNNIAWNFAEPFASFSATLFEKEYRVTLIHHSTSANRKSKVFLRSMNQSHPTLSLFDESAERQHFFQALIQGKKNILISGSTGSGKTTFVRALLNEVSPEEHVVVLEDTHEITTFSPHQTSLLSQQDMQKKSLKDYCAYALRMSPDRLIVGEMRSTEVVPFMLAMNTGHKGLMSTIHANSASDALSRIALLFSLYAENKEIDFALIMKLACKNIDYVVHMENKKVVEIARVLGSEGDQPYFELV
jgi:type IV secretory pathway ATPase VirB11/archaellum biosynthesis ATPase